MLERNVRTGGIVRIVRLTFFFFLRFLFLPCPPTVRSPPSCPSESSCSPSYPSTTRRFSPRPTLESIAFPRGFWWADSSSFVSWVLTKHETKNPFVWSSPGTHRTSPSASRIDKNIGRHDEVMTHGTYGCRTVASRPVRRGGAKREERPSYQQW